MTTSYGRAPQAPAAVRVCSVGRGLLSEVPRWDADRAELLWSTFGRSGAPLPSARTDASGDGLAFVTGPPCPR